MQVPAKADYAIRALLTLAETGGSESADHLAHEQKIPPKFLGAILADLRRGGIVTSQRGAEGGFALARPAREITIADVLRVLTGPLAAVRGLRAESLAYEGAAEHLGEVWIAVRGSLRDVLEHVTLADIASGKLPEAVTRYSSDPANWLGRT